MGLVNRVVPPAELEELCAHVRIHHRRQRAADHQGGEDGDQRARSRTPSGGSCATVEAAITACRASERLRRGPPRLHAEAQAGLHGQIA